ncbi:uncharacterized protein [Coffea arabica]|uniref:Uncharacterized protein n=1 Tax=Coffea arabica TaxID=13443 RepID=A0ABM4W427_COFAR
MTSDYPKAWSSWLPLAEYWYNTNFHSAIKTTPFQVVYGQAPPVHIPYLPGSATVDAVDRSLAARERALHTLKHNLKTAQHRMKHLADKHRSDREFQVGDLVLQLPAQAKIHSTFHVSLLKKKVGQQPVTTHLPETTTDQGHLLVEPTAILDRRLVKHGNKAATQVLVQWSSSFPEDVMWEFLYDLRQSRENLTGEEVKNGSDNGNDEKLREGMRVKRDGAEETGGSSEEDALNIS